MKWTLFITIYSLSFMLACQPNNINRVDLTENESSEDIKSSTLKIIDTIDKKDLLDTNIYNGHFPPDGLIRENLKDAPLIAEGKILQVDSISEYGDKIVTFQIDSLWKGKVPTKIIKYITTSDFTLEEFKDNSHGKKEIIFFKKFPKVRKYEYKDSIEFTPISSFASFGLDRDFKNYLLEKQKDLKKLKN